MLAHTRRDGVPRALPPPVRRLGDAPGLSARGVEATLVRWLKFRIDTKVKLERASIRICRWSHVEGGRKEGGCEGGTGCVDE
eukprot:2517810-Rhodomonas_salina.1